jgi:hypothetical protein
MIFTKIKTPIKVFEWHFYNKTENLFGRAQPKKLSMRSKRRKQI